MATQPKPKPKPEPKPEEEDDAARAPTVELDIPHSAEERAAHTGVSLLERVENLENRMTAVEERQNAPPIGLGRRA